MRLRIFSWLLHIIPSLKPTPMTNKNSQTKGHDIILVGHFCPSVRQQLFRSYKLHLSSKVCLLGREEDRESENFALGHPEWKTAERPEEEPRGNQGPTHLTIFSPHLPPSCCLSALQTNLDLWNFLESPLRKARSFHTNWKTLYIPVEIIIISESWSTPPPFFEERTWASLQVRVPAPPLPPVWSPMRKDGSVSPLVKCGFTENKMSQYLKHFSEHLVEEKFSRNKVYHYYFRLWTLTQFINKELYNHCA